MRNLLDFLTKHAHWLLFILLEVVCAMLLFQYNSYQGSVWFTSANAVVGRIYDWNAALTSFFSLRQVNEQLTLRNFYLERQVNQLSRLYGDATHDSTAQERAMLHTLSQYQVVQAQVVGGSLHQSSNLFTINRGKADGVDAEMGVVSGCGVMGVVLKASDHYAVVMPVINVNSRVSCTIRRRGYFGVLRWYGQDASVAYVEDIPRHARFKLGDWVETNGYSAIYPPGVPVGKIEQVYNSRDGLSYRVKVRLATDFSNLRNVCVLVDRQISERVHLLQSVQDSLKMGGKE